MREHPFKIREAVAQDAEDIAGIYNHYIAHTIITFEEEAVTAADMADRIREIQSFQLPWLVAEQDNRVVGYAYASKWKGRCAYRFSAEVTVYVSPDHFGKGIGSKLYGRLLPVLRSSGMHAAMGGIALPNEASIRLHEKMGFVKVAQFKEVGFKFDTWIDVGYWQAIL